MPPLDFPNAPTTGQSFSGPNGAFSWDGVKWVPSPSSGLFVPEAPSDGKTYGRKNAGWNSVDAMVAPAFNDIGRNKLHNGLFRVLQRSTGPFTVSGGLTADRWQLYFTNDTDSVTVVSLSDADRTAIGDEEAQTALQIAFTGSATAGSYSAIGQRIESIRRLSGKTVVASFWARAISGTPKLGAGIYLVFGSGGSPSPGVPAPGAATPALTTSWTRYSQTISIPSAAGKTFGTNGNDCTQFDIYLSCTTNGTNDAPAIGQQSGTVQIWGVQLEVAQPGQTTPSPLEKPDICYELSNAQRFYQVGLFEIYGYQVGGQPIGYVMRCAQMRTQPTLTPTTTGSSNVASSSFVPWGNVGDSIEVEAFASATGTVRWYGTYTASADL